LKMLRHLQGLPAVYHENTPVGETMSCLEQDVEQVGSLGGDFVPYILRLTMVTIMIVIAMLVMNWRLSIIVLPLFPVFLWLRHHFRLRQRQISDVVRTYQGKVTSFLQEHLAAMVQVQLLTRELTVARRFLQLAGEGVRVQSSLLRTNQ